MADGLTEEKLSELADALANDKNLPTLGLKLGFRRSKVEMYINSNKRNESSEGTSSMLFDWKRKTPKARQIPDLVKALNDSDFVDLADEFFSGQAESTAQGQKENPSPSALNVDSTSSPNKREVTDGEITKLSKLLPDRIYDEFFETLGYDFNYHQKVKKKHLMDSTAASKELLQEWKDKGGFVDDLDAVLKKADVGGLISKYKK